MKLRPLFIEVLPIRKQAGDLVESARHKGQIKIFGSYENSYLNEIVKQFDLILVDPKSKLTHNDFFINNDTDTIHRFKSKYVGVPEDDWYKIIIVGDKKFNLPQPSQESIDWLLEEYNKNGSLPEWVFVEGINWDDVNNCKADIESFDYPDFMGNYSFSVIPKTNKNGLIDICKLNEDDEIKGLLINLKFNKINCEEALEQLSEIDYSPTLLHDDNGHWAVTFVTIQNVPKGNNPENMIISSSVKKDFWKKTIKEALIYSLEN